MLTPMKHPMIRPFSAPLFIVLGIIFAIAAVLSWISQVKAPALVREKIEKAVSDNCATCKIEIGNVSTPLIPFGDIVLNDIKFSYGTKGAAEVEADVKQVKLHVSKLEPFRITHLEITSPNVKYTEGDKEVPKRKSDEKPEETTQASFIIEKTTLTDGRITYVRNTHGTHAVLRVHSIKVDIAELSDDPKKTSELIQANAVAQIEDSGTVDLDLKIAPLNETLKMNIDFRVRDQNLADLNTFLKPNAGVELRGILIRGRSRLHVRDRESKVRVWAEYKGLGVNLEKTYDTSEFEAFIVQMGAELTMDEKNNEKPEDEQLATTTHTRKQDQGIVGFLVQGMKEAAIKVAQSRTVK